MAILKEPFALDKSLNTTEGTPRNIADVLAEELSRITGRNASQVEYDNTESGLTADNVQEALDEINGKIPTVPSVDIQTAVDEFSTYNGGLLSSLKVSLTPNQDLHGYDSPWVGGASKNKMPLTVENLKAWNTSGTWSGNTYSYGGMDFSILTDDDNNVIGIDENGTTSSYPTFKIFSGTLNGSYRLCRNNARSRVYVNGSQVDDGTSDYSFTASGENYEINLFTGAVTLNHQTVKPMLVLSTETDYTFEPYTNICPISGHTQVDVGDDGKNKADQSTFIQGTLASATGEYSPSTKRLVSPFIMVDENKTYTLSTNTSNLYVYEVYCYDKNQSFLSPYQTINAESGTPTLKANTKYIRFTIRKSDNSDITPDILTALMMNEGSTAPYVPYNGYQVTVNLGGTYYSGTLDVVTGVLTPDTAELVYDGSNDEGWSIQNVVDGNTLFISTVNIPLPNYSTKYQCSVSNPNTAGSSTSTAGTYIYNSTLRVRVTPDVASTVSDFTTWLSNNPLQIVYKLATPLTIQLSPTMVKALVGENHLSAPLEGQEITESKYKQMFTFDDVIAYIQSLS